jgi:hypothetical protein
LERERRAEWLEGEQPPNSGLAKTAVDDLGFGWSRALASRGWGVGWHDAVPPACGGRTIRSVEKSEQVMDGNPFVRHSDLAGQGRCVRILKISRPRMSPAGRQTGIA